jgi:hypothetical protein
MSALLLAQVIPWNRRTVHQRNSEKPMTGLMHNWASEKRSPQDHSSFAAEFKSATVIQGRSKSEAT